MAGKKLPKNIDLTKNLNPADGFFSTTIKDTDAKSIENVVENVIKKTNAGGRPVKNGLKNEQFTLTMDPEIYEKLRIVAKEQCRGNFSGLIDEAVKSYCRENNIDLSSIKVDPDVLEIYRTRQEKRKSKK